MKTNQRSIPLDHLSVEDAEYRVSICTHGQSLVVTVYRGGEEVMHEWMTLPEFAQLLSNAMKK